MEKSTTFVVQAVGGLLSKILNNSNDMIVEVLTTPDCQNCSVVEKYLDDIGVKYDVIDVTENSEYLEKYPVFTAPAIVIDGKLEFTGVPSKSQLAKRLGMV